MARANSGVRSGQRRLPIPDLITSGQTVRDEINPCLVELPGCQQRRHRPACKRLSRPPGSYLVLGILVDGHGHDPRGSVELSGAAQQVDGSNNQQQSRLRSGRPSDGTPTPVEKPWFPHATPAR
ncbi:hypothetical protein QCM80_31640 [Bradyrhizobium sp. SSUT112]|uniref:hypothetical protein n=1 Tax=Bradyrhizobium sp. SSUT112 TaxID=3040604 RepID=UPI00244903C4|nr:hypothetical protein [Bradyrhizobium sp. SSUT112]MDH2355186.1 hypothetical protein [Bradyrhizobium sp. SSUT112]